MADHELPKRYDPKAIETPCYERWESTGAFAARDGGAKPYTIVLPPPNVTGSLHVGHALTAAVQDALIRWKRMTGHNALWLPGTDHAGIATQMVVERQLAANGEPGREELGRSAFLDKVWQWKETNGSRIQEQHRILGASLDWSRERFTMDEGFSKAVVEAFVRLHEEGLIYRAERLINWSPALKTSLSDLEVDHREMPGHLWHIAYPVTGSDERLVVATTRPETLLGDTAVAVHPEDPRYQHLIGKTIDLPLTERKIPIVADAILVDLEFGSGAVKVTPAHDFNDFETGKRHGLSMINVLDDGAHISLPGPYFGQSVAEARKSVVADLQTAGLMVEIEDHGHSVGHCQRSGCVVEPRLSMQWFVNTEPLAKKATEATRSGATKIVPQRFESTWYHWMDNIQHWCISRQLWWGHRIPAWYAPEGQVFVARSAEEARAQATAAGLSNDVPLTQEEDVLDTWFSSGLWPMGTLGWPDQTEALKTFYPTAVLETGHDILFFWVARMMMMGIHFTGVPPFHTIFLHGMVRDGDGQKMSKTKGNVVDPVDVTEEYGADALRLSLLLSAGPGRDLRLDMQRVEGYRNFLTKVWNATRFAQSFFRASEPADWQQPTGPAERWIRSRLAATQEAVNKSLEDYRLDDAGKAVYHFVWHELCDWYIELAKPTLYGDDPAAVGAARAALVDALDGALRLLHPFCPFVTEELWQYLPQQVRAGDSISSADFFAPAAADPTADRQVQLAMDTIGILRTLRAELGLKPREPLAVRIATEAAEDRTALIAVSDLVRHLGHCASLSIEEAGQERPPGWLVTPGAGLSVLADLRGKVDVASETERLTRERAKNEAELKRCRGKLGNARFVDRAPQDVVAQERQRLEEFERRGRELEQAVARLVELEAC
jgi:valyl-tRNA synthetase